MLSNLQAVAVQLGATLYGRRRVAAAGRRGWHGSAAASQHLRPEVEESHLDPVSDEVCAPGLVRITRLHIGAPVRTVTTQDHLGRVAKAASNSRLVPELRTSICSPMARATSCTFSRVHSIIVSAAANSISGMARPSAWAVLRLIMSLNLVGFCTGRSAGFAPLRIWGT